MRTAQPGDRVQVHYRIRAEDGSRASSRGRGPLELTVGEDHPRLPGLGSALVGLAPGDRAMVKVPSEWAAGPHDPDCVRRYSRERFPDPDQLQPGKLARYLDGQGRSRMVRVQRVDGAVVLVDGNRRWAGQTLELLVKLVAIEQPSTGVDDRAE